MNSNEDNQGMLPEERRAVVSLAGIFSLRMIGLFMLLPILSLHTEAMSDATPVLIGLALGAYGFTQGLLQIPYGMLSDKFGRKPLITIGLLVFALGSVVAAYADSILMIIIGRAIQGAGAIAAVVMALLADLTREEQRTKAMASVGASIGFSFMLAIILGPLLNQWVGLSGVFWFTAIFALLGLLLLWFWVPNPQVSEFHQDAEPVPAQFINVLSNIELLRINFGIFSLHAVLTANFIVLPLMLREFLTPDQHSFVYLGVLFVAILVMVPAIIIAEKKQKMKPIFTGAVFALAIAEFSMGLFSNSLLEIILLLTLFFAAFNVLEATLPSLVSKLAPPEKKGTAMGLYSSSQFFGAFIGGITGGWLYGQFGASSLFFAAGTLMLLWFIVAITMRNPSLLLQL